MKYLSILFIFFSFQGYTQSPELTKIINQIDYQNDTLLSVYNWVTDNIAYDVRMAEEMKKGVSMYEKGKFKNEGEYRRAQLKRVINKKKGVCQDYTLLFQKIVTELGYTSYAIGGITKDRKGKVTTSIGHSWIAIKEDEKWKLFDPTWGAGYVNEKNKFIKKQNDIWYDVDPGMMLERHFPFDPIWQFVSAPMTFNDFKKRKGGIKVTVDQEENSEVRDAFIQMDKRSQCADELGRVELLKINSKLFKSRLDYLKNIANGSTVKGILKNCKKNSITFSEYINEGKNKRFSGPKWNKEYSLVALHDLEHSVEQTITGLKSIKAKDSRNKKMLSKNVSISKKLLKRIKKELKLLNK